MFHIPAKAQENQEGSQGENLAEKLNVDIKEISRPKFEKTPTYSGATVDESELSVRYYDASDEWMMVIFKYTVDDWTDEGDSKPSREEKKLNPLVAEVTFKIFIEGTQKANEKKGQKEALSVLLTGEVTYMNVKKTDSSSRFRYGVFFLSPDTVQLYDLKNMYNSAREIFESKLILAIKKRSRAKIQSKFIKI